MNLMVGRIHRYTNLLMLFMKINYLQELEYRVDFFSGIIPQVLYSIGYIAFIGVIFGRTPLLGGWGFDRMLMLFATSQVIYYGSWLLYRNSLEEFVDSVRNGDFDFTVKLPINTRFVVSTRIQTANMIIAFLGAIGLLVYALKGVHIIFSGLLVYIFLLLCGFVIYYNILFTLQSMAFWIIDAADLEWFADDLTRFGSYPAKVYPTLMQYLFTGVIPVLLLCYVPVTAILNELDWKMAVASVVMVILTSFVSQKIWTAGLRTYSSASS